MYRVVSLFCLAIAAVPASAQTANLFRFLGQNVSERSGSAVAFAGDADNDGITDVLIGAPENDKKGPRSGTARLYSGASGKLLHEVHGDFNGDRFGCAVAGIGDIDGDNHDDFIVGACFDDNNGPDSGSARVFSGKTAAILRTLDGDSLGDKFGFAVAGVGDINGDGTPDFAVSAPEDDPNRKSASGTTYVYSGRDFRKLYEWAGATQFDNYGWSIAGAGDTDNDGTPDIIIGTQELLGSRFGYAHIRSGKSGAILRTFRGTVIGGYLGFSVDGCGDVDGDKHDDVIVGAYRESRNGRNSGVARVYSGKTGNVIWSFRGDQADDELGTSVAGAGDVSGDGVPDLLVGIPGDDDKGINSGAIRLYSGKDGSLLMDWDGGQPLIRFGQKVAGNGALNTDPFADILVGAPNDNAGGGLSGAAYAHSYRSLTLWSDRLELSLAKGQKQQLTLNAGTAHQGKAYFLVGSITGVKPGLALGNLVLPLNLDPYTQLTIGFPNSPLLSNSLGTLDNQGFGTATWTAIPQLPASLVGQVFWHAFVVISNGFEFTSVHTPVILRS